MEKPIILSFDVGVFNLSYCILTYTNNWEIIEWDNIDLTNKTNEICFCGKKATLSNIINNEFIYYCNKHGKQIEINTDSFENHYNKCELKTYQCCYKNKQNDCCNKNASYYSNQYYCTIHAKTEYKKTNKDKDIKILKKTKLTSINFDDIKIKIITELDKHKHFLNVNYVIIENQPSFKNPRMKSIASTIYDYYLIRGIMDKELNKSNIIQVKFQAPSNKLKLITLEDKEKITNIKNNKTQSSNNKTYKITKELSIKYCLNLIQHLPDKITFLNNQKKKDDYADSFLQGVYFYNKIV